jgi:hypothetical protein
MNTSPDGNEEQPYNRSSGINDSNYHPDDDHGCTSLEKSNVEMTDNPESLGAPKVNRSHYLSFSIHSSANS